MAPALAYGNTVVFKPADLVPGTAWALVEIISRAGLPKGVLNLVMGRGSVVGQTMLDSRMSMRYPSRLGRNRSLPWPAPRAVPSTSWKWWQNPLVVLDDANLDIAVNCARRRLLPDRPALHGIFTPRRWFQDHDALSSAWSKEQLKVVTR
jgi:aldehyde dehydrogenase (NAD+)